MADLRTTYLGVELKNPIILGASSLVEDIDAIKKIERAGISAIVYRSLFEEQIHLESIQLEDRLSEYDERHGEMINIFPEIKHAGAKEFLLKLSKFTKEVNVPVFASLNALTDETWIEYSGLLEKTGVAGLELNFYDVPVDFSKSSAEIEEKQLKIFKEIKKQLKIPISVKLSPFYSNPLNFIQKLDDAGAAGIILFNRFFQPEIDIDKENYFYPFDLSSEKDYHLSIRFAGLLYGNINANIIASRGISDGNDVIKMLLAGANSVQVVSTLYRNKPSHLTKMLETVESWMDFKGYKTIDEFRGNLSHKNLENKYAYLRAQYVDILMGSDEIINRYPMT